MNPVPMLYMKDDLMKAVEAYVIGRIWAWNEQMKQFTPGEQLMFTFMMNMSDKVYKYVMGVQRNIDGSFGDLAADIALQANRIFQVHVIYILERDLKQISPYNNIAEYERVESQLAFIKGRR